MKKDKYLCKSTEKLMIPNFSGFNFNKYGIIKELSINEESRITLNIKDNYNGINEIRGKL